MSSLSVQRGGFFIDFGLQIIAKALQKVILSRQQKHKQKHAGKKRTFYFLGVFLGHFLKYVPNNFGQTQK